MSTASVEYRSASRTTKPLSRGTRTALVVIALVSLVEAAALLGAYLLHSRWVISTDNAQIDAKRTDLIAPVSGVLVDWSVTSGSSVRDGQVMGRIEVPGSTRSRRPIRSVGAGSVASNEVHEGQYVLQGSRLATVYAPGSVHVTARVSEHDVGEVVVGQRVDIQVDAYPQALVLGLVTDVRAAAASQDEVYPNPDADPANPQKTEQFIPVRIDVVDAGGATLSPGMNVTVDIRKR